MMVVNDMEYQICDKCGAFMSSPRCLNCSPLTGSEEWIHEEVKPYYSNISNDEAAQVREDIRGRRCIKGKPRGRTGRPGIVVKHHLLEYFFRRNTLQRCGQYDNVPDRFLLDVNTRNHHRTIDGKKLHEYILEKKRSTEQSQSVSEWASIEERLRVEPDFFLKQIPVELILLFKAN